MDAGSTKRGPPGQRRLATLGLVGAVASFAAFASQYTRVVTNNLWNDPAFSGWSSAVGHQLATGRVLFRDVTLPMPPGSFVVLSWVERASGHPGPRLIDENRVCALCYVLMALLGYAIAKPIAGRRVALATAGALLGWICIWIKELAYDPLAEVGAWATLALLVHAWVREPGPRERRLLFAAGIAAGATLWFKQSTAVGVLAGGAVGLVYLAVVERREPGAVAARARGMLALGAGGALGGGLTLGAVALGGGSVLAFLRAVFVDGPMLKGGTGYLAVRTTWSLVTQPIVGGSLGMIALFAVLVLVMARRSDGLHVDADARSLLATRTVLGFALLAVVVFGIGMLLLASRGHPPLVLWLFAALSPLTIVFSMCLAVAVFFGNRRVLAASRPARAFNAAALAALVVCSTVSMSMTSFNSFYENNPMMAIVLIALFASLQRARLRKLSWVALAAMMGMPVAWRVPRAMVATHVVRDASFFAGMRVDAAGKSIVQVAERARSLAGPHGTVLSLPEDPSLGALIGRPRPDLCGAIVFSDQYPRRCVEHDVALLEHHPPTVLVLRPANRKQALGALRIWNAYSPAEALLTRFLDARLGDYERVATYKTRWLRGTAPLEIWRLRAATSAGWAARD